MCQDHTQMTGATQYCSTCQSQRTVFHITLEKLQKRRTKKANSAYFLEQEHTKQAMSHSQRAEWQSRDHEQGKCLRKKQKANLEKCKKN